LIVTEPVLVAVDKYGLNLTEICITALHAEIERLDSISGAIAHTSASREAEILELKEVLNFMQERLDTAEEALARHKHSVWHR
jgi:hypothetical protein